MKNSVAEKEKAIEGISRQFQEASAIYLVDYLGLTVEEVNALRKQLREEAVYYKVLKNTYMSRAAEKSGLKEINPYLVGPTAVAASTADEVAPARIISEFAKKNRKQLPKFKAGIVDGKIVTDKEIEQIAKLPKKHVLLSMLASGLNAPIVKFAQTLKACISNIVYALDAVREKKEKAENQS
jgi:large subunit ribosomal protein L10